MVYENRDRKHRRGYKNYLETLELIQAVEIGGARGLPEEAQARPDRTSAPSSGVEDVVADTTKEKTLPWYVSRAKGNTKKHKYL